MESICIRDKPDAFFGAEKMHLPVGSGGFAKSRLYAIFIKESHRNTRVYSKIKRACWPFRIFPWYSIVNTKNHNGFLVFSMVSP